MNTYWPFPVNTVTFAPFAFRPIFLLSTIAALFYFFAALMFLAMHPGKAHPADRGLHWLRIFAGLFARRRGLDHREPLFCYRPAFDVR